MKAQITELEPGRVSDVCVCVLETWEGGHGRGETPSRKWQRTQNVPPSSVRSRALYSTSLASHLFAIYLLSLPFPLYCLPFPDAPFLPSAVSVSPCCTHSSLCDQHQRGVCSAAQSVLIAQLYTCGSLSHRGMTLWASSLSPLVFIELGISG